MGRETMGQLLARALCMFWCLAGLLACSNPQPAAVALSRPADDGRLAPWQARVGHTRPLIAVLGQNDGTEISDFVLPYGILRQAGVADVLAVAAHPGPIRFRPALSIAPDLTMSEFDGRHAEGADYVIVPAFVADRIDDFLLADWLRAQAAKGAKIVSICDGALVVAHAGLFKGRKATGHWATQSQRESDFKDTRWLKNVRYVEDGNVISSAGVTAAIPLSLALVEAIGGHERAAAVARQIGARGWSSAHDSERFGITPGVAFAYVTNRWLMPEQDVAIPVADGVDELALALAMDVYARTGRSHALAFGAGAKTVTSAHGLHLVGLTTGQPAGTRSVPLAAAPALDVMRRALDDLDQRYGKGTVHLVTQQLEYPER